MVISEMDKIRSEENILKEKLEALTVKKQELLKKKERLVIEDKNKQRVKSVLDKHESINRTLKNFPYLEKFRKTTTRFFQLYDNFTAHIEKFNDVDLSLHSEIAKAYRHCMGVLGDEVKETQLLFNTEMMEWRNGVDKQIAKLKRR